MPRVGLKRGVEIPPSVPTPTSFLPKTCNVKAHRITSRGDQDGREPVALQRRSQIKENRLKERGMAWHSHLYPKIKDTNHESIFATDSRSQPKARFHRSASRTASDLPHRSLQNECNLAVVEVETQLTSRSCCEDLQM